MGSLIKTPRELTMTKLTECEQYYAIAQKSTAFAGGHAIHTPRALVEEILSKLPLTGEILVLFNVEFVISLVYTYGIDPAHITFFSDHPNKVKLLQRIGVTKYLDTLDTTMKFDVVVGNPPYQSSSTGADPVSGRLSGKRDLYDKFAFKASQLSDVWALVMPCFWMGRQDHKLYKHIIPKCDTIIHTASYFPSVKGVDTAVFVVSHTTNDNVTLIDGSSIVSIDKNHVSGFADADTLAVLQKVTGPGMDTIHFQSNEYVRSKISAAITGYAYVDITGPATTADPVYAYSTVPLSQKHTGTYRLVCNWNASRTSLGAIKEIVDVTAPISASCVALVCNSAAERVNLKQLLETKLYKFIVQAVKTSATNNKATFKKLPLLDLTRSWTDAELYDHFNLTITERALIEATIK